MPTWWSKLRALFRRDDLDQELRAELDAHFDLEVEANLARGMSPSDALRKARRDFGNRAIIQESSQETWAFGWLEAFLKDLRYGLRILRRSPGFALTAVTVIALGIGATTATFSIVNAVLLRPLPYPDRERLVFLWGDLRTRDVTDFLFAPGDFHDLRETGVVFEELAAIDSEALSLSGDDGEPERVRVTTVTPNLLSMLGARILHGRNFTEADGVASRPSAPTDASALAEMQPPVPISVILGHGLWQRRYGSDLRVVGRVIDLAGGRAEVVGVLAPGFELLFPPGSDIDATPDLYAAARVDYGSGSRLDVSLNVLGRLEPGVSLEQAQHHLDRFAEDLRKRFPIKAAAGYHIRAEPMHEDLVADVRGMLMPLMGAVTFVLLIACANVSNLLLVRVGSRMRELAVRAALGGSRWRLVCQVLAEGLVLAGAGVGLGLGLAALGIQALEVLGPQDLPRIGSANIDRRVLAFGIISAVLAVAVFAIVPAVRASRPDVMGILRASGRSGSLGGGRLLRDTVVVTEVALSFILLVGSGLMMRSFAELRRAYPGYDPNGVLTFALENVRLPGSDARAAFAGDLRRRLLALPGVRSVSAAQSIPLDGEAGNVRWGTAAAAADPSAFQQATSNFVLPDFFETLGTRLREGRTFTEQDNSPDTRFIVIDRLLAAKAFPASNSVGQLLLVRSRGDEPEWLEIIGVVDHQRIFSPAIDGREAIYFVDGFVEHAAASRWLIRTSEDPATLASQVRSLVRAASPTAVIADVQPMQALVDRAAAPTRFALVLIATFATIAVVLATVGLYGVLSTSVRQRTSEIGVRLAFGATPSEIATLVLWQGLRVSAIGVGLGCIGAFVLTPFMASMLIAVAPTDALTFASIAVGFLVISMVASYLPARRAASLDPVAALRE